MTTRKDRRRVIGFFTDEDGVVHPITARAAAAARAIHRGRPARRTDPPATKYHREPMAAADAAEWEALARELEEEAMYGDVDRFYDREREGRGAAVADRGLVGAGWTELKREIMARGGINRGRGGDHSRHTYDRESIPGGLYRLRGASPDKLAVELGWEDTDSMLRDLTTAFDSYRRHRARASAARPRRRRPKVAA